MINPITSSILSEIMTVHGLALYLKTSDAKVYRMARTHDLPAFRIGKSWRFKKKMIDMWISQKWMLVGKSVLFNFNCLKRCEIYGGN